MPDVIKDRLDDAALFVVFREGDDPACLEGLATRLDLLAKTAAELGFAGLRDKAAALAGVVAAQKNSGAVDWEAITGELDILQDQYRLVKDQGEPAAEVSGSDELPVGEELSPHAGTPGENCAGRYTSLDEVHVTRLVDLAGELRSVQAGLRNALTEHTGDLRLSKLLQRLHQVGGAIRDSALALHTLPVHGLFEDLTQYALQLAHRDGRLLRVATGGSGIAVDRSAVKDIAEPLRTMIRGGLEFAEPQAETVLHLNATRISASVRLELLFDRLPGLRSSFLEDSDNLAGAREALLRIGAKVDYRVDTPEQLAVIIGLPSSHRAIEGLLVRYQGWQFVLPTASIREIFLPAAGQMTMARAGVRTMLYRNRLYPAVRLDQSFGVGGADTASGALAVIVNHQDHALCLLVDELLGKEEVVVKSLGPALSGIANLAGGAILADGRVGLVIDVAGLCRGQQGQGQQINVSTPGCGP